MSISGQYFRRYTCDKNYDPTNGWQRKWTYKVAWKGSGDSPSLIAMTDGMTIVLKSKEELREWLYINDMVQMTKDEVMGFIMYTSFNTDFKYQPKDNNE